MITKDYSVKEAAKAVGVVPMTILRRIRDGKLSAYRTNGDSGPYRITQEALDDYRKAQQLPIGVA